MHRSGRHYGPVDRSPRRGEDQDLSLLQASDAHGPTGQRHAVDWLALLCALRRIDLDSTQRHFSYVCTAKENGHAAVHRDGLGESRGDSTDSGSDRHRELPTSTGELDHSRWVRVGPRRCKPWAWPGMGRVNCERYWTGQHLRWTWLLEGHRDPDHLG